MKISAIAAGVALCLAGFGGTVYAQQNSQQDSSGDNAVNWVGSRTPSAPESPATTRYEAQSMLRQAKQDCQRDSSAQSRQDCLQPAQSEYKDMMASAREHADESGTQNSQQGMQHRSQNSHRHNSQSSQGSGSMNSHGSMNSGSMNSGSMNSGSMNSQGSPQNDNSQGGSNNK